MLLLCVLLRVRWRGVLQEGAPHTAVCPVPTVYGVTNPYFLRACTSCRNVMTIMHAPPALLAPGSLSRTGDLATADRNNNNKNSSSTGRTLQMQSRRASSFADMSGALSGHADGISLQPGLACTAPDKHVLAKLKAAAESSSPAMWDSASNTLRTHFFNLTVAFLMPFYDFCGVGCPWSSTHQVRLQAPVCCVCSGHTIDPCFNVRLLAFTKACHP